MLAGLAASYQKHREARIAGQRAYYQRNRERALAWQKEWRSANRPEHLEACRRWAKANADKKRWYRSKRRAAKLGSVADFTAAQWRELVAASGGRCHYCHQPAKLTPDHKVALVRGGAHTAENIVAACMSCNRRKGAKPYEEFVTGMQSVAA
jgi:5-methylcytosine-specific restriction endonuclease McrA